jgi:endonuclease/exonuclease/phosphatase family metal-dependent hydrolase
VVVYLPLRQEKLVLGSNPNRVINAHIGRTGSSTAFHQEWHLLRLGGNLQPNPRKAFITDMTIEINKWKSEGAHIILGGDFNENMGDTMDGLAQLASTCKLTDAHGLFHDVADEPATYVRGRKRLDYVLASDGVLPFIR